MTIKPTSPGPRPQVSVGRSQGLPESAPARPEERSDLKTQQPATDQVHISDDARRLEQTVHDSRQAIAQLPPGRLKQLLERIYGGFYDDPDVITEVVQRLDKELTSFGPQG
jgi:hypothetical protein